MQTVPGGPAGGTMSAAAQADGREHGTAGDAVAGGQTPLVQAALEAVLGRSDSRLDTAARHERIKAAALMECARNGYGNLAIADIARRARVSTATIYEAYGDRDTLLVAAMEMALGIVAADVIAVPASDDPRVRVEQLLVAHGEVYRQPLAAWFHRLHVTLAWSGHPHLHVTGRVVSEGIDRFWRQFLNGLVETGHLQPLDCDVVIPLILGPVERATIIARLACGDTDPARPALEDVARHCTAILFDLWGARADASPPATPDAAAVAGLVSAMGRLEGPALPLARLAQAFREGSDRPTPRARLRRILLAAAVECQDRGYNAAGVLEVSARARVSTATLYKQFRDKADLFVTALEHEVQLRSRSGPLQAAIQALVAGDGSDALATAIFLVAASEADPDWAWMPNIVMASEISGTARVARVGRRNRSRVEALVAAVLARSGAPAGRDAGPAGAPAGPGAHGSDRALALNFLLGGVERSGVLALILFGRPAVSLQALATLSLAAADCLSRWQAVRQPAIRV